MKTPGIFVFAIVVVAVVLLDVVSGAIVTNSFAIGTTAALAQGSLIFSLVSHRHASEGAGTLVILLAIWITIAGNSRLVKIFAWFAVGCVAAEALLGRSAVPLNPEQIAANTTDFVGFLHAFLAQGLIALMVVVVMLSWPGWERKPEQILDKGWPSLRSLAISTLHALILQVALGAAFRHNILGVLWHILGAFLVVVFGLAMLVLITQVPENRSLRAPVIWMASLLGVQISLGMVLISISEPVRHPIVSAVTVALHVLVGATAMGVGVLTAMLVRRSVSLPIAAAAS